jgi:hypothetical protein
MRAWTWAAASARGTSHLSTNEPCQDAQVCRRLSGDGRFACVIADGAGSARYGGAGAALACQSIMASVRDWDADDGAPPSDNDIWSWVDLARDVLGATADRRGERRREFACTLIVALATLQGVVIAHIGDGGVALRDAEDGSWRIASWPAHGEYASTTHFLTDDPKPDLRIVRDPGAITGLAAFTDGLERLLIDFGEMQAHQPFFSDIIRAVDGSAAIGRDQGLCQALRTYLDSAAINHRTDDDKTLVLAVAK